MTLLGSALVATTAALASLARGRCAAKARATGSIDFGLGCRKTNRKKIVGRRSLPRSGIAQADKAEGRVSAAVAAVRAEIV